RSAIAGGIEAPLAPLCFGAFAIIRAMSTRNDDPEHACRPFDRQRDGFIMGEGACALVLERWDRAEARGARIYAELAGYANTNDAHHMTAPRPDGAQAARAMRAARASAGVRPEEVDYISPHGSSTPLNDATETLAIQQVFGEHAYRIPLSGTKPYHAHALGASGAIEAAIACLSIERGWIPPTLNLEQPDDDCDLDYAPTTAASSGPTSSSPTPSASAGSTPAWCCAAPDGFAGHRFAGHRRGFAAAGLRPRYARPELRSRFAGARLRAGCAGAGGGNAGRVDQARAGSQPIQRRHRRRGAQAARSARRSPEPKARSPGPKGRSPGAAKSRPGDRANRRPAGAAAASARQRACSSRKWRHGLPLRPFWSR